MKLLLLTALHFNLDSHIIADPAQISEGELMSELKHLLSPMSVKKTEIPDRVVTPPMGTGLCNPDGAVNDVLLAYMNRQNEYGDKINIPWLRAPQIVARKRFTLYVWNCFKKHSG